MKKLVLVLALLVAVPLVLAGCSDSESDTVKNSIKDFVGAYNAKDYDMCTGCLLGVTDANKETVRASLEMARDFTGEIEVTSIETPAVDGDSATAKVTVKIQGETQTNTVSLTKVDGKWKFGLGDLLSAG
jgi:uncharacterized protein YdeI (BOF family)